MTVTYCAQCKRPLKSMARLCPRCALSWNVSRNKRQRALVADGVCVDCRVARVDRPDGLRCEACAFKRRIGRGDA